MSNASATTAHSPAAADPMRRALVVGALGVVYGDVGAKELRIDPDDASSFLGREAPVPTTTRPDLPAWREGLFASMTRNAVGASDYFRIPPKRVVELGTQVEP